MISGTAHRYLYFELISYYICQGHHLHEIDPGECIWDPHLGEGAVAEGQQWHHSKEHGHGLCHG